MKLSFLFNLSIKNCVTVIMNFAKHNVTDMLQIDFYMINYIIRIFTEKGKIEFVKFM